MYLLSSHPITLAEGRMEFSPVMALWPIHTSSQILPSVTPHLKPFLFQARLFHGEECRQIRSHSLKLRPCFQGVYLGSEEPCLSGLIFRGGAGFLGHTVGQESFSSTFYCFYQSYYNLLNTQVNAEQVQLVTGLPLDGINETKVNTDTDNIFEIIVGGLELKMCQWPG